MGLFGKTKEKVKKGVDKTAEVGKKVVKDPGGSLDKAANKTVEVGKKVVDKTKETVDKV